MSNEKLAKGLAVFASSYVKRWMETNYDVLMRSAPARKLMEAGAPTRYGTETALYALFAFADQHWSTHTPLRTLIREVAMDAPAEIAKRLVNGFRDQVVSAPPESASEPSRSAERALLDLDDATLGGLLVWLARASPEDRTRMGSLMDTLSDEQLRTSEEDREASAYPPSARLPSRLSQAIKDELTQAHGRVDEQLAAHRARRRP